MSRNPQALQLRFLQTVAEVAAERNSTLVMPIPVELLSFFRGIEDGLGALAGGPAPERHAPDREPGGEPIGARTLPMPLERPGSDRPDAGRGPERPV
jgi:hypothetical protein